MGVVAGTVYLNRNVGAAPERRQLYQARERNLSFAFNSVCSCAITSNFSDSVDHSNKFDNLHSALPRRTIPALFVFPAP